MLEHLLIIWMRICMVNKGWNVSKIKSIALCLFKIFTSSEICKWHRLLNFPMTECKNEWVWFEPVHLNDGWSTYRNYWTPNISKSLAYSFLWKTQLLTAMFHCKLLVHVLASLTCADTAKSLSDCLHTKRNIF